LKKEKTSSKQSKKKEKEKAEEKKDKGATLKVLVPLLSKKETHPLFVEKVANKAKEIILLLVIDTHAMSGGFGFATNEIAGGNHLMQEVKTALGKKRKTCNDIIEWGDTATKIEHLAQLQRIDKLYIVNQDNQTFKDLLANMKISLKGIEIETVDIPEEE